VRRIEWVAHRWACRHATRRLDVMDCISTLPTTTRVTTRWACPFPRDARVKTAAADDRVWALWRTVSVCVSVHRDRLHHRTGLVLQLQALTLHPFTQSVFCPAPAAPFTAGVLVPAHWLLPLAVYTRSTLCAVRTSISSVKAMASSTAINVVFVCCFAGK